MVQLNIILCEEITKKIEIESDKTVLELKSVCVSEIESLKNEEKDNLYFIFGGQTLKNDEKIGSIRNIENGTSLHLKIKSERNETPNHEPEVFNQTVEQLNRAKVLHQNLHIRVTGAQRNKEPTSLERRDHPDNAHPHNVTPRVKDLGYLVQDVAQTLLIWSHQLSQLGEILVEDKPLGSDRNDPEYSRTRKAIQNNMDGCRYSAHMMTALSRFVIPLAQDPGRSGRELKTVQNRR